METPRSGAVASVGDSLGLCNHIPEAQLAGPSVGAKNQSLTFDASASSDVDGDPLSFNWSLTVPPGRNAQLVPNDRGEAQLLAAPVGTYGIEVVVSDGELESEPASLSVTIQNAAPVANAGVDFARLIGETAVLDGTASSDEDGDAITYRWELLSAPARSAAVLNGAETAQPSFLIDERGTYVAQLVVGDGDALSVPDTVQVAGGFSGSPPTARVVMSSTTTRVGATVNLDGSLSSDPDGDPLTYLWRLVTAPTGVTGTLQSPTSTRATFRPGGPGTFQIELVVSDGAFVSDPAAVAITAERPTPGSGPDRFDPNEIHFIGTLSRTCDAECAAIARYDSPDLFATGFNFQGAQKQGVIAEDGRFLFIDEDGDLRGFRRDSYLNLPEDVVNSYPNDPHANDDLILAGACGVLAQGEVYEVAGDVWYNCGSTGAFRTAPRAGMPTPREFLVPRGEEAISLGPNEYIAYNERPPTAVSVRRMSDQSIVGNPIPIQTDSIVFARHSVDGWLVSYEPSGGGRRVLDFVRYSDGARTRQGEYEGPLPANPPGATRLDDDVYGQLDHLGRLYLLEREGQLANIIRFVPDGADQGTEVYTFRSEPAVLYFNGAFVSAR